MTWDVTLYHLLIEIEETEVQEGVMRIQAPSKRRGMQAWATDATYSVCSLSCLCRVDGIPRSVA